MTVELLGCADRGCLVDPPAVGTTGGRCRCLDAALSRLSPEERRLVRALLADRLRLRDELDATRRDLCRAVARTRRPSEVAADFGWHDLYWDEYGE